MYFYVNEIRNEIKQYSKQQQQKCCRIKQNILMMKIITKVAGKNSCILIFDFSANTIKKNYMTRRIFAYDNI